MFTAGPRIELRTAPARARAAQRDPATALRSAAATAPRPTYSRRSNLSRAFSRKAVIAHLLRKSHARLPLATASFVQPMACQWRVAPDAAVRVRSCSTPGDASAQAPNTRPWIAPYVCSLCCTGPTYPSGVPQYWASTLLALPAYSACNARARRATASHLRSELG